MKASFVNIHGLSGDITSSPSKSYSHRAFFLSILQKTPMMLYNILDVGDLEYTLLVCRAIGATIEKKGDNQYYIIPPKQVISSGELLDCRNSGTTIRIFTALSLLIQGSIKLTGLFFERGRPLDELIESMQPLGTQCTRLFDNQKKLIGCEISTPKLLGNVIKIKGDISSQFITGLIIAACGLSLRNQQAHQKGFQFNEFIIESITPMKSFPYVLMTQEIAEYFRISVKIELKPNDCHKIIIPIKNLDSEPPIEYHPQPQYYVPGDFSSAAFMIVAACLFGTGKCIKITYLNKDSKQGDKKIVSIVQKMGAYLRIDSDYIIIEPPKPGSHLHGIDIDCSDIPDLFPILCILGAYADGTTKLYNAEHVRLKETDRVAVMTRELKKFTIDIQENKDGVTIRGSAGKFKLTENITIITDQDHRIIMSMAIFCLGVSQDKHKIIIDNVEYVSDSYPEFFNHLKELGAQISFI
jgi:3-phosphoshikimate 1-carboxyvinyltransferase